MTPTGDNINDNVRGNDDSALLPWEISPLFMLDNSEWQKGKSRLYLSGSLLGLILSVL